MNAIAAVSTVYCLTAVLGSAAPWANAAEDEPEAAANACLERVGELYPQHRFNEAADKYVCAADALAKAPGHEERAARYRANAWFYRSWGTYTEKPITGPLRRANLEDAIRQVQESLNLWQSTQSPQGKVGEQLARAWLRYLSGVQLGAAGQYAASHDDFNKAREMFTQIGEQAPAVREVTDLLLGLAEDQTVFAEVMNATTDPGSFTSQGGYINARLDDMKRRALPETRPYYESLAAEFRAGRQFFEAGDRLEAWDYPDADAILAEAKKALATAQPGAAAVPDTRPRASYQAMLVGWNRLVDAERHHAAALKSLLADGNTAKAKDELLKGVADYRTAQAEFETAGFPPGSIASIEKSYARLRERAAAVSQAFGPTQAVLAIGWTFFGFFVVTLGALTMLRSRLRLKPTLILWTSLVVALISAFSLRSIELLQVLNLGGILR
jgi:hypothetical protein